ncbi:phytanoyl-CoA dioxygenase family protein [Oscillatoria salina]|uniref:phytanoyl-CoA dioxygenase family protein n=1 Tax=Oscillatoria salina TaxID=331517 RepID=UPI001CCDF7B5|nr:phytanoyl-CoA dioxygenase family protein [Oscillatoria salina]MBZ8179875.1 hypothetical protein [Oscillatoria salina IIICB1]
MITSQSQFVNEIEISSSDIHSFSKQGFLKLKKLFTPQAIEYFKELTLAQIAAPAGFYPNSEMSKLKYGINNSVIKEMYSSREFDVFNKLTQKKLLFLQGVGFQMDTEKKGFDWHVGVFSFNFLMPEDFACSLWIPLDPINTRQQHGGMAYVPKNVVSADTYFFLVDRLIREDDFLEALSLGQFNNFYHAPEMEAFLLEKDKIEDDFEIGDALLFDKFVWHRSCPLKPGNLKSRTAFVMRFSGDKSRYSKTLLNRLDLAMERLNYNTQTKLGSKFSELSDGDLILEMNKNYVGAKASV